MACSRGHSEAASVLLKQHPTLDVGTDRCKVLRIACQNGHVDCVKLILERSHARAPIATLNGFALRKAAANGHLHVVEELLKQPVDSSLAVPPRCDH